MDPQLLRKYTKQFIDQNGNTLLHKAVKNRNFTLLHKAALMETSVNKQNKDGYSALHYAVKHGDISMIESVLMCGVSPLLKTKLGETARDIAVRNKLDDIVSLLDFYGQGLEVYILNKNTSRAIDLLNSWVSLGNVARSCLQSEHRESFKRNLLSMHLEYYRTQNHFIHLLAADDFEEVSAILGGRDGASRVNVNSVHAGNGSTPISLAVLNSNVKMLNLLLDFGANVRTRLSDGTPLTHYSWDIHAPFQILLCLMRDRQTWHMRSPVNGLTILFVLVADPDTSAVHIHKLLEVTECAILVDRDPEGRDVHEFSLLHKRQDLVDSMLESVAELVQKKNGKLKLISLAVALLGQTVLNVPEDVFLRVYDDGTSESMTEIYRQFMRNVSSLEIASTRLFASVGLGELAAVKKYNVADFVNKIGRTALHEAILGDKYDIARWLLAERPSLRMIGDLNNRYPLHYAYAVISQYGKKYVHLLLENSDQDVLEKMTDVNNNVPSALYINSKGLFIRDN